MIEKLIFFVWFTAPIVLGTIAHNSTTLKVMSIRRKTNFITTNHLFSYVTIFLYSIMTLLVLIHKFFGEDVNKGLWVLILVMPFWVLHSFLYRHNLYKVIGENGKAFSIVLGIVTFSVVSISSPFVDSTIVNTTTLPASSLPDSQLILLFIVAPLFWFIIAYILFFLCYAYQLVVFLFSVSLGSERFRKFSEVVGSILTKQRTKISLNKELNIDYILFLGLSIALVISGPSFSKFVASDDYYRIVERAIVFSSYHGDSSLCENLDNEELNIAVIPRSKEVGIAWKHNGKYIFDKIECIRPPINDELKKVLIMKHIDKNS